MSKKSKGPYTLWSATFHRKDALELGERPAWLYFCMTQECRILRSDGWLTERQIDALPVSGWRPRLATLIEHGMVERVADGRYWIPGYLKWNKGEQSYRDQSEQGRHYACQRWHEQPCKRSSCADLNPAAVNGGPNG